MIYITGDTHGDFKRFKTEAFSVQRQMTKKDYIIVCGDFGIWHDTPEQNYWLDWLEKRPFTTLFVSGNHENYDYLRTFEIAEFCGGEAQLIRPSIIHLMRGQVFTIEGKRFFTMGGASSHDVADGILSQNDPDYEKKKKKLIKNKGRFRIEHLSWWKEELPSVEEYSAAWASLENAGKSVDHIITHCPPESIRLLMELLGAKGYPRDELTEFLEQVKEQISYSSWFFGHYHCDAKIIDNHYFVYKDIVPLVLADSHFTEKKQDN